MTTTRKTSGPTRKRVAVVVRTVGDYHAPRLLRLQSDLSADGHDLLVIEASRISSFYKHQQNRTLSLKKALNCVTLDRSSLTRNLFALVSEFLRYRPDYILALGYSDGLSLCALATAKLLDSQVFFMADSKADDQPRTPAGEWVKSQIVSRFDGALVAGLKHKSYFSGLGLNPHRIEIGFDVVDNAYFSTRAEKFRKKKRLASKVLSENRYVLCVSRLVTRKRVDVAMEVFLQSGLANCGYKLLIVGEGPERSSLETTIMRRGLQKSVVLCGSVKSSRMPLYYAFAEALLLASEYDQWGLVVNEALACGLPALITERCGAAGEILLHGINGYVWDGQDPMKAGRLLADLVLDEHKNQEFRAAGRQTMRNWGLDRFSNSFRSLISRDTNVSQGDGRQSQQHPR